MFRKMTSLMAVLLVSFAMTEEAAAAASSRNLQEGQQCPDLEGTWTSSQYSSFRIPDAAKEYEYVFEENQSFTLQITDQHEEDCTFRATMSHKPNQHIAGVALSDGSLWMVHTSLSGDGIISATVDGNNEIMTLAYTTGYNETEAFETELAKGDDAPPSSSSSSLCPEVSPDAAWVSLHPYHSGLAMDDGRVRLTWDQNQTFNIHEIRNCAFIGYNDWRSEREGGPNHQSVVGVVSKRLSSKGDTQLFAAQAGAFGTLKLPLTIHEEDGSLNYMGLTHHTGGPYFDYFAFGRTQEFFDSQYLTTMLTNDCEYCTPGYSTSEKLVQGIDLEAEFTPAHPENDELTADNTGIDIWQVLLAPVDDASLNKSDNAIPYGFLGMEDFLGTGDDTKSRANCAEAQSLIGMSTWTSTNGTTVAGASVTSSGGFARYTSISSTLEIMYWGTAAYNECYFAGTHTYTDPSGETVVAGFVGQAEVLGGVDTSSAVNVQLVQSGPCKAVILGTIKEDGDTMDIVYMCPKSNWEDQTLTDYMASIFATTLSRVEDDGALATENEEEDFTTTPDDSSSKAAQMKKSMILPTISIIAFWLFQGLATNL